MAGFENDVMYSKNADFTQADNQAPLEANGLATNGQLWIGTTAVNAGSTHINVGSLTSPGGTITIGYSSPNITLESSGSVPTTFTTNSGNAIPIANTLIIVGSTTSAGTSPLVTTGGGNTVTVVAQRSQAIAATDATKVGLSNFNSAQFSVDGNGFVSSLSSLSDLHVAKLIVNSSGTSGTGANYSTITAALTAAVSGDTIFVMPGATGTYTENLTLKAGVNITAFTGDSFTPTVTIIGKITDTITGTASISNIRLQTNGDYVLESTGANAGTVYLNGCYINATNANAIHITNANSNILLINCFGDCSTNTYFIATAGTIKAFHSNLASGTNTTTNSTFANANFELQYCYMACPITTSGTGSVSFYKAQIVCTNTTALTHGGSGNSIAMETRFESGTASAISIGATLPVVHCSVFSTNANAITGAGTLLYGIIVFYGASASSGVNTVTQTALATLI